MHRWKNRLVNDVKNKNLENRRSKIQLLVRRKRYLREKTNRMDEFLVAQLRRKRRCKAMQGRRSAIRTDLSRVREAVIMQEMGVDIGKKSRKWGVRIVNVIEVATAHQRHGVLNDRARGGMSGWLESMSHVLA